MSPEADYWPGVGFKRIIPEEIKPVGTEEWNHKLAAQYNALAEAVNQEPVTTCSLQAVLTQSLKSQDLIEEFLTFIEEKDRTAFSYPSDNIKTQRMADMPNPQSPFTSALHLREARQTADRLLRQIMNNQVKVEGMTYKELEQPMRKEICKVLMARKWENGFPVARFWPVYDRTRGWREKPLCIVPGDGPTGIEKVRQQELEKVQEEQKKIKAKKVVEQPDEDGMESEW